MQIIGGGCRYPVAAHAELIGIKLFLELCRTNLNTIKLKKIKQETSLDNVWEVAKTVAKQMLEEKFD